MEQSEHNQQEKTGRIARIKSWVQQNERLVTSSAFMGGFGIDLLTLNRIDQWFDNFILLSYLVIACIAILIINTDIEERFGLAIISKASPLALYAAQFAFGGLLSGFVIFYTKSASWYVAWPFLIGLYLLFLANDRMLKYYKRLEVQTGMLFGAIMAMSIFFVPTTLKMVGDLIFIISGIVSIILMIIFLKFLYWLLPSISQIRRWKIRKNVFFIFLIFNILYFTNVIPPIPLSLKQIDVYHDVKRTDQNQYTITKQDYAWYQLNKKIWNKEFIKNSSNDRVFVFASIFGPEELRADVFHKWQWFNPQTETWKDVIEVDYALTGGRDGGFRWYSFVTDPTPGLWRVRVTADHDREIGRINFEVKTGEKPKLIQEKI